MPTEVEEKVSVPSINCSISEADYQELLQTIPNDHISSLQDGSYGLNKYLQVHMCYVLMSINNNKYTIIRDNEITTQLTKESNNQ